MRCRTSDARCFAIVAMCVAAIRIATAGGCGRGRGLVVGRGRRVRGGGRGVGCLYPGKGKSHCKSCSREWLQDPTSQNHMWVAWLDGQRHT